MKRGIVSVLKLCGNANVNLVQQLRVILDNKRVVASYGL